MNVVEVCILGSGSPSNRDYFINSDDTFPIDCKNSLKVKSTVKSTFPNKSNKSFQKDVLTKSTCMNDAKIDQSHNSSYNPKYLNTQDLHNREIILNKDFHGKLWSPYFKDGREFNKIQESVKITETSSKYTSTVGITPRKITNCPEMSRTSTDISLKQSYLPVILNENPYLTWQLNSDHNKLSKSEFLQVNDTFHESEILPQSTSDQCSKPVVSKSIQTIPVLILPLTSYGTKVS